MITVHHALQLRRELDLDWQGVAVELTFETIGVLAIVVLIRTFLSLTLEVEMSGKWPWQNKQ